MGWSVTNRDAGQQPQHLSSGPEPRRWSMQAICERREALGSLVGALRRPATPRRLAEGWGWGWASRMVRIPPVLVGISTVAVWASSVAA